MEHDLYFYFTILFPTLIHLLCKVSFTAPITLLLRYGEKIEIFFILKVFKLVSLIYFQLFIIFYIGDYVSSSTSFNPLINFFSEIKSDLFMDFLLFIVPFFSPSKIISNFSPPSFIISNPNPNFPSLNAS